MFDVRCSTSDDSATRKVRRHRRHIAHRTSHLAHALVVLLFAAPALALTPAVLVGPDLERQPVTVTGLRGDRLIFFDQDRRLRSESVSQFVQLRQIGGAAPAADGVAQPYIELIDGQRLTGTLQALEAGSPDDGLHWQTPTLGTVRVALDQVRRVVLTPGAPDLAQGDTVASTDAAILVNGDIITGFIAAVTGDGVELTPDGAPTMTLPLDRVAALRLANPVSLADVADPRESRLALHDGSQVRITDLELAGERVTFRLPLALDGEEPRSLPLADVTRIDFTGSGWRLVALADQPMSVQAGGDVFGLAMPPRIEGGRILMHAPVTVRFELPPSARRLTAHARLNVDDSVPVQAVDWADVEVVVQAGGETDDRVRLSARQRDATINLPVAGEALRVELRPGVNGPILDRVRLDDALLLLHLPVREPTDSAQ